MSERALAFVEKWTSEHIRAEGVAPQGGHSQAKALALQFLADAKAKGISAAEIGESIDDLTEFMAGAIAEANEREAHRLTEKND
jgi:hypothetical protein